MSLSSPHIVEIPWAKTLPNHWSVKKGKWEWRKESRPVREEDEIVTAFRDGEVTLRKNRREDGFTIATQEHGYQGIRKGDLVIHGMDAFAGAIGVSDSDGKSSPVYAACTPKNDCDPYYFAYLLKEMSRSGWIEALAKGIRERSTEFKFPMFSNLEYPIPPSSEQKAIANFLDKKTAEIKHFIELKEKTIELLKERKTAIINQAVTKGLDPSVEMKDSGIEWLGEVPAHWEVKKFSREVYYQEGPGIMAVDFKESGVPLIRISGVQEDFVTLKGCNYLDPLKVKRKWSHFKLNKSDLIISCSASTDLISEVDEKAEGCIAYTGLIRLKPRRDNLSKNYLKYFIKSEVYSEQVELLKAGSAMQHYGPSHIRRFFIVLPSTSEQTKIVEYLNKRCFDINQSISFEEREIALIKEYQESLISEAVTGKIDVREYSIKETKV